MPIQISGVQMGVITGGPSALALEDLSDVSIVSPQTGQYLRYNSGISEWQNAYLGSDIYDFLNTNMSGSNGVDVTFTPGPNTIDISLGLTASGDATGAVSSSNLPLTLATVNSNVGTYGSGTAIPVVTVNAKGLITAVSTVSFSGTSPLATSLAGGSTGALPYQSSANNTAFLAAGTSSQLLIGGAGAPSWSSSISGLTAVGATTFTGALTGNASTATILQTTRTFSATGDATATAQNFNGSANVALPMVLATVNSDVGTFASATFNAKGLATAAAALSGDATTSGASITLATVNGSPQTDTFRKATVNGKGLVTATSAVVALDITTALGFTPVNKAGDTMGGYLILNADPVSALGAATRQYVDNVASGVTVHAASVTSTTAALPASTYNNGASGVGATLTANANGAIGTVGGYASLAVNNRVLVKDQAAGLQNGIYTVTQLGSAGTPWILTRATDFDGAPSTEIQSGDATYVQNGTLAGTQWIVTTTGTITVGTTAIVFSQFSGPGTYVGGAGINVAGTTISNTGVLSNIAGTGIGVSGATGNVTITNNGVVSVAGTSNQITVSGATGAVTFSLPASVTIGGTMTAGTFSGSGASLTSIPNGALTNSSLTVGSTNIALGATSTTLAGLTSVTSTTFVGALTGNATTATTATNLSGGAAGSVPYQSGAGATTLLAAGTSSQVLVSGSTPAWTNTPTLTGTNFSGTAASLNIGGNAGTATILQTTRTINGTNFNGSANITVTASTTAALTMNNGGAGVASGTTFDGGTARTLSYNTIGAPSTTGTNASGTWGINVTGNAATVTNNPARTDPTAYPVLWAPNGGITGQPTYSCTAVNIQSSTGTLNATVFAGQTLNGTVQSNFQGSQASGIATSTGSLGGIMVQGPGGGTGAFMSFHRPGIYAAYLGLDTDSVLKFGGWSAGAVAYPIAMGNSGTYTMSVTGNAATAGGFTPSASSGVANRIVVANASGYINNTYFNTSADSGNTTASHFAMQVSSDNYIRWMTAANTAAFLGPTITSLGNIATINGTSPTNGAIRLTPNLHLNSGSGNAVILNWDNGNTGTTQTVRIGNGAGADIWYCGQAGQTVQSASATVLTWLGVGSGTYSATAGDITSVRTSAPNTGVIFFGNSSNAKYLFYDGTNYNLNTSGLIVGGDVTAFSDIRVKKNIELIPDALNKVLQIRGVTFNRTDTDEPDRRHSGVIAQEVEAVLPEVVSESLGDTDGKGAGTKTVAYGNMVGLLIEAIKELNAKVDSLKAELAALKE